MRFGYGQLERLARPKAPHAASAGELEEVLVADARAGLTPADMVDRKLLHLLRGRPGRVVVRGERLRLQDDTNVRPSAPDDSSTEQTPHPEGTGYASNSVG